MGRTPDGPARDQPWWKEMLGIGTKREWILVGVLVLFFCGLTYEQEGPRKAVWAATTSVVALLIGAWWKKRQELKAEEEARPVLGLGDSERDEYGAPD